MTQRAWAMVMVVATMAACGAPPPYGSCNGANEPWDGDVDLSGETPVFDWSFGTAYALSVSEDDDGERGRTMWHIQCGGYNMSEGDDLEEMACIPTPIAYGEAVSSPHFDDLNHKRPRKLVPGQSYLVSLNTVIEADSELAEPDRPDWLDFLPTREERSQRDDPRCGSGFTAEVTFVAPGDEV
jgi:hypothetical protein